MFRTISKFSYLFVMVAIASLLAGCGNNPDSLFKKGDYANAYTEFVKRGQLNDSAMRQETVNGSFSSRNSAANQAVHDYYYAAECQKQLGNTAQANLFYQKVVDTSKYQIRVPANQSELVKSAYDSFLQSVRDFRSREVSLTQSSSSSSSSSSSTGNTDPYSSGSTGSTGGNTDPYSGGSTGTTGGNTDPYSGGSSSNTYTTDTLYQSYYNSMVSRRREFERLLYATTTAQMPDIANLRREYEYVARGLDSYLRVAAYGGVLQKPNSYTTATLYNGFADDSTQYQRQLNSAAGVTTYTTYNLQLKEPNLVSQAAAAIGVSADASTAQITTEPTTPSTTSTTQTSGTTTVTGDLASAQAAMQAAYQKYQSLLTTQGVTQEEIMTALKAYKDAQAVYNELKVQSLK